MSPLVGKLTASAPQPSEPESAIAPRRPQAAAQPEPAGADEPSLEALFIEHVGRPSDDSTRLATDVVAPSLPAGGLA